MTTITVRMDAKLKQDLQAKAKRLGISLNQLINLKMRELNQQQTLTVDMCDDGFDPLDTSDWGDGFNAKMELLHKRADQVFTDLKEQGRL